jgi:hypothetical protein
MVSAKVWPGRWDVRSHLIQLLGRQGDVADQVGVDVELAVVVVGGVDDLVGHGVVEDGMGSAAVECPGVQGQPQAVLKGARRPEA